jgi:hypothetical protein
MQRMLMCRLELPYKKMLRRSETSHAELLNIEQWTESGEPKPSNLVE